MMSRATIFWLVALAAMVVMTVTVSLKVNRIDSKIDAIAVRKTEVQDRIALLDASYALLTSAERLAPLADRHLDLVEVRGDQLIAFEKLPFRIPLPTARQPEPEHGQPSNQEVARPADPPPALSIPPMISPPSDIAPPGALPPRMPPWLEAQGRAGLQPVTLSPHNGRPQ